MKQIIKNNEPQAILDWKADANEDWQPTYRDAPKQIYRNNLAVEQGYICCYCNQDISNNDFHIEHFRPQEDFEHLEIEYSNLHASCLKNKKKGTPSHCGDAKANWFDNTLTFSPLDDHEASFKYLGNGNIEPSNQNSSEMILRLNLNEESLKAKRKSDIFGFLEEHVIENASSDELVSLYNRINKKVDGKYQPFIVALQQQIKQLLPQNLAANL